MTLPVATNEWSVQLASAPAPAFARRADGYAYVLDAGNESAPPFALQLALGEAGEAPAAIALYEGGDAIGDEFSRQWQQALGIPVYRARASEKTFAMPKTGNLLVGDFAAASPVLGWLTLAKPAGLLLAVIAVLQATFVLADWWQLDRQRAALEREMRATFQSAFPQATAIVDPALQMRRNLDALKRERGVMRADDPRAALARLAAITASVPQLKVSAVSIKDGQARLVGTLAADTAMQALQERVAALPDATLAAGAVAGTVEIVLRLGA
jgi:general secretion pathway protein L